MAQNFVFLRKFFLILALAGAGQALAQSEVEVLKKEIETLRRSQEDLMRRLLEQNQRLEELEQKLGPTGAAAKLPAAETEAAEKGFVRWKELATRNSRLKFYGSLRLDAIYDDSRPNNTQTIAFIRSEDPSAPAGIGNGDNGENEGDFTLHPRLTRFGIDFDGPEVTALADAKVTGKLEIDFYNNGLLGQAESREAVRLRHGYLRLGWKDLSLLAGQTSDVISPLWPIVNPDLVMWGAGNLGDRRPQIRPEYRHDLGPGLISLQGEIGLTGADDNQDLDVPGTFGAGFRDGETSSKPTLQGRLAYLHPLWAKQTFELGIWGHRAWEEPDTKFAGKSVFDSSAVGLDMTLPLYRDILSFKGELWYGENVDDVRGGIFQGINTNTGQEIRSRGGFGELGWRSVDWTSFHMGYSEDDPLNSDLPLGGRASNRILYVAQRFYFDPIEFGMDYLYWTTKYVGFEEGDDNRFQFFISYKF